ncbi:MAG: hypothetical protein BWK80_01180 [Desulfobacteraceae bacterium IS3]|nr:MAG: hypothetical protein BWK80_01180 [Desulfobacteraceae bacterium IS3]
MDTEGLRLCRVPPGNTEGGFYFLTANRFYTNSLSKLQVADASCPEPAGRTKRGVSALATSQHVRRFITV